MLHETLLALSAMMGVIMDMYHEAVVAVRRRTVVGRRRSPW
uniref:Uncharacterized protein n=1 Tax=Parascaris equorum TaxID=6256 RepID=A0A914RPV3_PAREQ